MCKHAVFQTMKLNWFYFQFYTEKPRGGQFNKRQRQVSELWRKKTYKQLHKIWEIEFQEMQPLDSKELVWENVFYIQPWLNKNHLNSQTFTELPVSTQNPVGG